MASALPERIDHVRGDESGLDIPAHAEALAAVGPDWLTDAFRAFGSLGGDNRVTAIRRLETCPGGSTGAKLFLTLDYARDEPGLPRELFVKFSRDFADKRRDHGRWEMADEARFAWIARLPGFPIDVPTPLFADYHQASGTGLIVTGLVPFGKGAVEPQHRKCADQGLADPLAYYRALVTALARLAAADKAGRLAADIDRRFPYDPGRGSSDPIRIDATQLRATVERARGFVADHPRLFPEELRDPGLFDRIAADAARILEGEAAIQAWLQADPEQIALCHWNAHIDNAWFWRDAAGALHCGLIDWGRVGRMTLASALWGCLSAAHHSVWDDHLDDLIALFAAEYRAHGGPAVDPAAIEARLMLHIATMGVGRILAFPEVILYRLPEAAGASGPFDPVFLRNDTARTCLHVFTVLLKLWQRRGFGARLDALGL
jgi:hypothetical protein